MRRLTWLPLVLATACGDNIRLAPLDAAADATPDATPDAPPDAPGPDHWQPIFDEVDRARLVQLVTDMAHERYSDAGRAQFRAYWTQYMTALGLTVTTLDYPASGNIMHRQRAGTDLEAVLAGPSPDSVVVIVHYDSIGPMGSETDNPGADDDMTGMAIELETARILVEHRAELAYTVRFVASDGEELGALSGAVAYGRSLKAAALAGGFHVIAAIDDEQSGWNCHADGACATAAWPTYDVFTCDAPTNTQFSYPALGDQLAAITAAYSPLAVTRGCLGPNSDHYAMWAAGFPAIVFSEHDPFDNNHFDQGGGDTVDKLDTDYLTMIARPTITFAASVAGIPRY